jgi:hypothetical protein
MNAESTDSAAFLYASYVELAKDYTTALRLASDLTTACNRGEAIDDRLTQILSLLNSIVKTDTSLAPVKQRWEEAGKPSSDSLRGVINHITDLIRQLCNEWQILERAVQARRDRLAVELDVCNRQCRMQRAYQRES